jgi:hypothetical protein
VRPPARGSAAHPALPAATPLPGPAAGPAATRGRASRGRRRSRSRRAAAIPPVVRTCDFGWLARSTTLRCGWLLLYSYSLCVAPTSQRLKLYISSQIGLRGVRFHNTTLRSRSAPVAAQLSAATIATSAERAVSAACEALCCMFACDAWRRLALPRAVLGSMAEFRLRMA